MFVTSEYITWTTKNKAMAWFYFAGVDTKITNVGISVKSTGSVYLQCVVFVDDTVKT